MHKTISETTEERNRFCFCNNGDNTVTMTNRAVIAASINAIKLADKIRIRHTDIPGAFIHIVFMKKMQDTDPPTSLTNNTPFDLR